MNFLSAVIKTGPYAHLTFAEKFQKFYQAKNVEQCWEYSGSLYRNGYGRFSVGLKGVLAHRVAFYIANGFITSQLVLHKCDNRACVNPAHLYLGSQKDNMQDAVSRNRIRPCRGEQSYRSKLTEEDVKHIFKLRAEGKSITEITTIFNVRRNHIGRVLSGKRWGWLNVS